MVVERAMRRTAASARELPAKLKAISLRQPWAEEIMLGEKTEEYRCTPTQHRGPIYIYASRGRLDSEQEIDWGQEHGINVDALPRGVIVGTVEIVDCREEDEGLFVWTLANAQRLPTPIACVVIPWRLQRPLGRATPSPMSSACAPIPSLR